MSKNTQPDTDHHEQSATQAVLDTRGTRCPLPLLRAKQELKRLLPGQLLTVLATDPSAKADFEAMLRHLPHELVSYSRQDDPSGKYSRIDTFVIRKGEAEGQPKPSHN